MYDHSPMDLNDDRFMLEEIQEVLLHSLPYCGAPATQEAFRAALEVINEYQKTE